MKNLSLFLSLALVLPVLVTPSTLITKGGKKTNMKQPPQKDSTQNSQQATDANVPPPTDSPDTQENLTDFSTDEGNGDGNPEPENAPSGTQDGDGEQSANPSDDAQEDGNGDPAEDPEEGTRQSSGDQEDNNSDSDDHDFTPVTNSESSSDENVNPKDSVKPDDSVKEDTQSERALEKEEVSSDEECSDFEDEMILREVPPTQKDHSSLWKRWQNPSEPNALINLFQSFENDCRVPDTEVVQYQRYVTQAIKKLSSEFENNHNQFDMADIETKRNLCKKNASNATKLLLILNEAKRHQIEITTPIRQMAQLWLNRNIEAIDKLAQAQREELDSFYETQTEMERNEAFGIATLPDSIKRFTKIKTQRFKEGPKKTANLNRVNELYAQIVEQLQKGEIKLEEVNTFVETISKKGILLDTNDLALLHSTIVQKQHENNESAQEKTKEMTEFDTKAQAIAENLVTLISTHNWDSFTLQSKSTPFIDHLKQFNLSLSETDQPTENQSESDTQDL